MNKQVIKIFQLSIIPLLKLLLLIVGRRKKIEFQPDKIEGNKTYVIVANHSGILDPFVICYNLPILVNFKLTPWWSFTKNSFFKNPLLLPFLSLLGCFPARKIIGKKSGLEYGLDLIGQGQNLVIFPEGKISRFDEKILPRTGVEMLATQPEVRLIPARVKRIRRRWLLRSYSLSVGLPFDGKNMTAEQIMDVVYSLKFR